MSVYKATSWGRTRRPKQLTDDHAVPDFQGKTTGTSVQVMNALPGAVGGLSNDLTGTSVGQNGYATENQRFLHLFLKHSAGVNKTVQVYGYNYAFGEWAPLFISLGNGQKSCNLLLPKWTFRASSSKFSQSSNMSYLLKDTTKFNSKLLMNVFASINDKNVVFTKITSLRQPSNF